MAVFCQRLFFIVCCLLPEIGALAQDDIAARRVFVPVEDLDAVIVKDQRGVLLPRDEFLKLYRDAQNNVPSSPKTPASAIVSGATYSAKFDGEQLIVEAKIQVSQFNDAWQAIALPLGAMAVESAKLDGQPAKLGRNDQSLFLLNNAAGEHSLILELSAPLTAVGADKVGSIGVLPGVAGSLKVAVPVGKHLQVDGLSLERPAPNDQLANYELVIGGKRTAVAIQLTDRQRERATDSLLFATTGFGLRVAPGEVTFHAITSLQVHGTPLDRLVCVVPKTLEITDVDSSGLEAWELSDHPDDANSTRITLNYRQPFDGSRRVDFRGVMSVPAGEPWSVPTLKINQITSHIGRALVQHAPSVRLRTMEAAGVRTAIANEVDLKNIGTNGSTDVSQVALLFDVWREDFSLGFVAQPKEQDVQASISSIFDLTAGGLDLITVATIETTFAPLFDLELSLPAEWLLTTVAVNGQPLPWHVRTREDEPGVNHVRIPLLQPLRPGQSVKLDLRAHRDPDIWPVEETPVEVALPELRLPQSSVTEGTYVIKADADLDVVPGDINGLDPANVPIAGTRLGFAYQDTRFGGTLKVERKPSRVSARTLTFARLDKQTSHTHFETDLEITGGGLRVLEVALAESAGKDLRFQLFNAAARIVEQTSQPSENGELLWTLRLDRHLVGTATLHVTSVVSRKAAASEQIPHLRFVAADRQNGYVAIEAEGDQRLTITAQDANKSNLPDVDPIDFPTPLTYAPNQRIVAAFRYFTSQPFVTIADERFDRLPVPTAICRVATITSSLSAAGEFQHQATFHFTAVGVQSLQVRLGAANDAAAHSTPQAPPAASLWAAMVDGHPIEVRRSNNTFLIPLPSYDDPNVERTLQLFYRTEVPALVGTGSLKQSPPELTVLNGAGTSQPMQVLDQHWELQYPQHLLLTDSRGAFVPNSPLDNTNWLARLPQMLSVPVRSSLSRMLVAFAVVLLIVAGIVSQSRGVILRRVLIVCCVLGVLSTLLLSQPVRYSRSPVVSSKSGSIEFFARSADDSAATVDFAEAAKELDSTMDRAEVLALQTPNSVSTATPMAPRSEPTDAPQAALPAAAAEPLAKSLSPAKRPMFAKDSQKQELSDLAPRDNADFKAVEDVTKADPQRFLRENEIRLGQELSGGTDQLRMNIRQQQQLHDDEFAGRRSAQASGGLLSLTLAMETQDGAAMQKFRYLGTESVANKIGLDVVYENRASGWSVRWLWIAAFGFIAWVLPTGWFRQRMLFATLGTTLPLAFAAIAPVVWQNTLDGIFFGTLTAVALWALQRGAEWFGQSLPKMRTKAFWTQSLTSRVVSIILVAAAISMVAADNLLAYADPPTNVVPPAVPPINSNPDVSAQPTIIVPYDDPKNPLAAERVYLPHAKFMELWNAAHPESKVVAPAPQDGLIAEALIVVTPKKVVADETPAARVTARVTLFNFRKQQIVLPVPLRLASLTEAKLDGEPAAIVAREENGSTRLHVVLNQPGLHVLDLIAEMPVTQQGPAGNVVLAIDPLPSGRLIFVPIAEETTFRVNGASNTFRARKGRLEKTLDANYFEVPISAGGDFRLAWQPKQAAGAVDAIVQADSTTAIGIEDAGVRIASNWNIKVPRGSINDVSFALPKELKIRSISGSDVGGWELGDNVDGRTLKVFLRRAVSDQTALAFELFLETRVADEAVTMEIPAFSPLAVTRDFGVVGLFASPQFSLKNVAVKGLTQINSEQFGKVASDSWIGASQPLSAFRYTARPFEIRLDAQRKAPESTGFAEHALVIERRKVRMSSRLRWELAGALRSSVGVQLPPGWLPVDVDATALQDWHLDPATNILTVEFSEPRIGAVEVVLQGNVAKEPDDSLAEITLPVPLELSKLTSQVALWFDPLYQPTISSANGWKTSDPEHCSEELRNKLNRAAKFVFTSNVLMPEALGFDLPRAVPKLSADAVSLVTVSDTAIDYSLALQWKIADAAADTFTFTTPDWLAGKLDFQGTGIRQTSFTSAGEGTGRTRWTVTLQDPIGLRYFLLATATLPPPSQRELMAPTIQFEGHAATMADAVADAAADPAANPPAEFSPLETQRQYVVAINIGSSQLAPVGDAGEVVQRDELPIVVDPRLVDQATAVLRIRNEKQIPKWSLKSFVVQAGTPASVNLADLTTVLAADGSWRMQAIYTIKNRSRQFLALRLPDKSQTLSVFVGDQPARLVETKKEGQVYQLIALPKTSEADLSFRVKLVLNGRLSIGALPRGLKLWSQEIELPTPHVVSPSDDKEFGIPVARTLWSVHVPKEWSAKPVNNPARNNLTPQGDDIAAIGYQAAWLQEANDLIRIIEGSNYRSSQRMQAHHNLKQLGSTLHSYRGRMGLGINSQSEEGRKLTESLQDFEAKNADLDRRVVIDSNNNFFVAKDQQQAAKAQAAKTQAGQNPNVDLFFDQLGTNDENQQRLVVIDNNRSLLFSNGGIVSNGEDRNGNGVLDPGEDTNGDGTLNIGETFSNGSGAVIADSTIKFKLNEAVASKPMSKRDTVTRGGRQIVAGKGVTEEDRLNRRKQASSQLGELNKSFEAEKQVKQQTQLQSQQTLSRSSGISSLNSPAVPGQGFGGAGGAAPQSATPQSRFGFGVNSNSGLAGTIVMSDGASNVEVEMAGNLGGGDDRSVPRGTEARGLSLPVEIQREGNVLRFSRTSGSPRLTLAIRPIESNKLGLGIVWSVVWAVTSIWLLRRIVASSTDCPWRQLTLGIGTLGLLSMLFMPSPLSELGFVTFAISAIALAIGVAVAKRQNAAA